MLQWKEGDKQKIARLEFELATAKAKKQPFFSVGRHEEIEMQLAAKEHQCSLILFALLFYSLPILTVEHIYSVSAAPQEVT